MKLEEINFHPDNLLVGKRDQEYIKSDADYYNRLIMYYNDIIEYANTLRIHGNYPHGMGNLKYFLIHNNTILYLRCDDEELKTKSHNMAMTGYSLYMGAYQGSERSQKLKEIAKDCENMITDLNEKHKE